MGSQSGAMQRLGILRRRTVVIVATPAARAARAARAAMLDGSRRGLAVRGGALVAGIAVIAGVLALRGTGPGPAWPVVGAVLPAVQATSPTPSPSDTPSPSPTPTPTPVPAPPGGGSGGAAAAPVYTLVDQLDAPTVNVHVPVVSVGIVHGAMDAPEGPLGSPFWREGFWLRQSAVPGTPGTATIAGHLDDTAGRPAAFWNIRGLHSGDAVTITRQSDGVVLTYKIVEIDVWSLAQANATANLNRIYGEGPSDGLSRLTLITCTGHWNGYEYDHRFVAFAVLQT
jgi:hypothetical protein